MSQRNRRKRRKGNKSTKECEDKDQRNIDLYNLNFGDSAVKDYLLNVVETIQSTLKDRLQLEDTDAISIYDSEQSKYMIFVNTLKSSSKNRYRFTLAHELGHIELNHFQDNTIYYRDSKSQAGTDLKEIQANRFAAEYLVPEKELSDMINMNVISIAELSQKFQVSEEMMKNRVKTLGYVVI